MHRDAVSLLSVAMLAVVAAASDLSAQTITQLIVTHRRQMSLGRAPTARSRYWCARLRVAFVVASSPRMTTTRGRQAERIRTYSMFSAVGCNENKWTAQMSSCAPEGATPGCRSISNSSRRWLTAHSTAWSTALGRARTGSVPTRATPASCHQGRW